MRFKDCFITSLTVFMIATVPALAAPKVDIKLDTKKVVTENKKEKMLPGDNAMPGDTILYTLKVSNTGDSAALKVQPVGNIPATTVYIPQAVSSKDYQVLFSIDNGKTFQAKPMIKVMENGREVLKPAPVESYSNVKWVINTLPSGKSLDLTYRVKVK